MDDELFTPNQRPPKDIIFTLNCDPETAANNFSADVHKSDNHTQEAFRKHVEGIPKTWLQKVAKMEFFNAMIHLACPFGNADSITAQREDFDLKVNALGKWAE